MALALMPLALMALTITVAVIAAVEVGRPLREGHRRRPLGSSVDCRRRRVGSRGRGGVGNPASLAAESPALVRRAVIDAEI